jgi:WD40 repeat protein
VAAALIALSSWVWYAARNQKVDREIVYVAASGSGRWIAAGAAQGLIAIWDRQNARPEQEVRIGQGTLNDLQFSPDERFLAVANRRLALCPIGHLDALHFVRSDDRNYGTVRFSSDGKSLLTITGAGTIQTVDTDSGKLQVTICCSTIYGEVAFSPDGALIANAGHWPALWDSRSGRLVGRLTKNREIETLRPIAFDIRRGTILMGSQNGRVYAWDLESRRLKAVSRGHPEYVDSIVVLKDSDWIAYAGFGTLVRLWNPDTGEERALASHPTTSNLAEGPDASIVFGTSSGSVEVWDTREGKLNRTLKLTE